MCIFFSPEGERILLSRPGPSDALSPHVAGGGGLLALPRGAQFSPLRLMQKGSRVQLEQMLHHEPLSASASAPSFLPCHRDGGCSARAAGGRRPSKEEEEEEAFPEGGRGWTGGAGRRKMGAC